MLEADLARGAPQKRRPAEDRYQTATGLAVDLRKCQAEWERNLEGYVRSPARGSGVANGDLT